MNSTERKARTRVRASTRAVRCVPALTQLTHSQRQPNSKSNSHSHSLTHCHSLSLAVARCRSLCCTVFRCCFCRGRSFLRSFVRSFVPTPTHTHPLTHSHLHQRLGHTHSLTHSLTHSQSTVLSFFLSGVVCCDVSTFDISRYFCEQNAGKARGRSYR